MSLGIMICNEQGIALGMDSLATQSKGIYDSTAHKKIGQSIGDLFDALGKGKAPCRNSVENEIGCAMGGAYHVVAVNSFYTKKLFPIFYKRGRPCGALLTVGYAETEAVIMRVVRQMESGWQFDGPLSFRDYVREVLRRTKHALRDKKHENNASRCLLAGYCPVTNKYLAYEVQVSTVARLADKKARIVIDKIVLGERGTEKEFWPIGDTAVLARLICGTDASADAQRIRRGWALAKGAIDILKRAGVSLNRGFAVEELRSLLTERRSDKQTLEQLDEILKDKRFRPRGGIFSFRDLIAILAIFEMNELRKNLRRGIDVTHFRQMSLRECLKVIKWLIDTTEEFHLHIKNENPTVGGEVYLATITAEEGFLYRNLADTF